MIRPPSRVLFLALLAIAAAACADQNPAGVAAGPPEAAPPQPPPVHAALQCAIDVRAATLACDAASPGAAPGPSAAIIGGQGTNVRLASSGTSYDAATQILRSDVTVENLMKQALGTVDGAFPAPEGVRVFFHAGPSATQGTGEVTVENADGVDAFTASAQPYFQYAGMLAPGDTTAPREWRFHVPPTVATFVFTVYVSAPVRGQTVPPAAVVLLGGTGLADTVDATPDSLLRIGVRGADGNPAANSLVQVSGAALAYPAYASEMLVASPGQAPSAYASGYTDARGIVEFRVKMGPRAGPARVIVDALYLGVKDTARYTVRPGAASTVMFLSHVLNAAIGARAVLSPMVLDRYSNFRGDTAALEVIAGPGKVDGNAVLAGPSIGRVTVVARVGIASDVAYVNVVPPGTVAVSAAANNTGEAAGLYVLSLDGSSVKRVKTSIVGTGYFGEMDVAWLGPTRLVYHDNNWNHTKQMYVLDLATGVTARFLPLPDWMEMENFPRVSHDGSWVLFSGGTYSGWSMYRAHADGTGKQRLSFGSQYYDEWSADLSPDGTRVVFVRDGVNYSGQLTMGNLSTGTAQSLGLSGLWPRWSPDGSRVAFVATFDSYLWGAGAPAVMNADGSGARALTTTQIRGDIDWSPDGRYVVGASAQTPNRLVIVDVETGAEVAIDYYGIEGSMKSPSWKP